MGKQKKEKSDEPPPELTDEEVERVRDILAEHGGQIKAGLLTTKIEGIKKVQLQPHFNIVDISSGDYGVTEFGTDFDASLEPPKEPNSKAVKRKPDHSQAPGPPKQKRQRKEKSDEPPPPLTDEEVEMIRGIVEENGGKIKGGILATKVEGLKKAQLQEHFQIVQIDSGDFWIAEADAMIEESAPSRATGEELEPDMVDAVRNEIEANGGEIDGGRLATILPGIKKQKLAAHFTLVESDSSYVVRDEGPTPESKRALLPKKANAKGKGTGKGIGKGTLIFPGKGKGKGKVSMQWGPGGPRVPMQADPMQMLLQMAGLPNYPPMRTNAYSAVNKGKGKAKAPTGPLTKSVVQGVYKLVSENGGSIKGGLLSTKFPGIKKAQLQGHFQVSDYTSGDYMVTLM